MNISWCDRCGHRFDEDERPYEWGYGRIAYTGTIDHQQIYDLCMTCVNELENIIDAEMFTNVPTI